MSARDDRVVGVIDRLLGERPPLPARAGADAARLWREHLRPYRDTIILAAGATAVWSVMPLAIAMAVRFMINDVLLEGKQAIAPDRMDHHLHLLGIFLAMALGLWSLRLAAHWVRNRLMVSVGQGLTYRLRKALHRKLQALHVGFFEQTPVGVIMARVLDDVSVIYKWLVGGCPQALAGIAQVLIGGAMLMFVRWQLAILVLAVLPVYAWAFAILRPRVRRANQALRRLNARMYARSAERIRGIKTVKAFTRERAEVKAFSGLAHDSARVSMRLARYNQALALIAGGVTAATTGILIYISGTLVRDGKLRLGDLTFFISAAATIFQAVSQLTSLATGAQAAFVVLRRVFAVLDEAEEVVPGKISLDGMRGRIVFDRVSFTYPNQSTPALDDVSFRIRPGEKVALMGPSGSGKTTVCQLLLRFYDPEPGQVRIGGVDLVEVDPASLRNHVRIVEQEPTVFADTIAENIRYGKLDATPEEIRRAAERAELHEFITTLPSGYHTEVGENGVTLSGGQKQRVALATALLTDPEVLLLDDTTSALDSATEARIRETLRHVLRGRTSLIVTQRVATARDCDRILVFENGRITQEGTHDELKSQEGFYADVCREQDETRG